MCRWNEEVALLQEEMRRVVTSHEYKAEWWREHRDGLGCQWPSVDHAEGAHVYGSEHTAMHESLIARCKAIWACNYQFTTQATGAAQEEGDDHSSNDQSSD